MDNPQSVCAAVLGALENVFDLTVAKMGTTMVAVGGVIVDGCCDGLLVVTPESALRTSQRAFPLIVMVDDYCEDPVIALTVMVSANRCLVPSDAKGRAAPRAKQEAVYQTVFADARIVWQVLASRDIVGSDSIGDPLWLRASLSQIFTADVGGCLGSETRVTFGVPGWQWCE